MSIGNTNKFRVRNPATVVVTAAWAVLIVIYVAYTSRYFFLFDDFALIGEASTHSIREIFGLPLFGFYRPIVFLLVKVESCLFSWAVPAGYLIVSQLLHLVNATLVFVLLRQFRLSQLAAMSGAILFALSPWSSEAYFWVSGIFDVLSTFGVLVSLTFIVSLRDRDDRPQQIVIGTIALLAACLAVLAKENAVVLPALVAAVVLAAPSRGQGTWRGWAYVGFMFIVSTAYLFIRSHVLPELGGAYGTAFSLFHSSELIGNGLSHLRAFVTVPLPGVPPGAKLPTAIVLLFCLMAVVISWLAWRGTPRLIGFAASGFLLTLAPVLWAQIGSFTSAGGRLMYLPGMWGCLVFAGAIHHLCDFPGSRRRAWAAMTTNGLLATALSAALVSVQHQSGGWLRAASSARVSIEQFRSLAGTEVEQVFIPNLPFWFADGPYVLKDYAFHHYFRGLKIPTVRTRNMLLETVDGRARFSAWVNPSGEIDSSTPAVATSAEHVFELRLPVVGMPSPVVLHPRKLSVFATNDAVRASDANVELTGAGDGSWRVDVPAPELFSVQPARGTGPATLRILPHKTEHDTDKIVEVLIRSDNSMRVLLATLTVRFKTMRAAGTASPFGSLDLPPGGSFTIQGPAPSVFQGWALDDFSLHRVWGEAVAVDGRRMRLGDATRDGVRPDVSRIFPNSHDLYNAGWALLVDPTTLTSLARPITVEVFAEDSDGHQSRIGVRTLR